MINPISSVPPTNISPVTPTPAPRPDPHAQTPPVPKSGELSHDQVTLKSAGQADHDADRE